MKFLTVKEAGEKLNLSPRSIRSLITSGKLPGYKIANEYRLKEEDLIEAIESCRVVV